VRRFRWRLKEHPHELVNQFCPATHQALGPTT
jgi:hypothetical protein